MALSGRAVMRYEEMYRRSVDEPEAFWAEEAHRIYWHKAPEQILHPYAMVKEE
jgi:hypothetical protein